MSTIFVVHNSYQMATQYYGIEDAAHKHRTNVYTTTRLSKFFNEIINIDWKEVRWQNTSLWNTTFNIKSISYNTIPYNSTQQPTV